MVYILIGGFLVLILLRVPISIAIGAATLVGFLFSDFRSMLHVIPQQMLEGADNTSLTAVPFFIMAGNLMNATGVTERIFAFANALVGHFKAGLAQVNILSSMIFAGISGAAVADCAGLGAIEVKAMRNAGYKGDFAAAVTVASSVVGPLIPPSVSMVLYAFLAQQSIERMFLASLVPGIMVGISLMIYVRIRARHEDFPVQERATFREITASAKEGILALIAPAIILFSIMFGIVTPTEAGVLACIYCCFVGVISRDLTLKGFYHALTDSAVMTSVIMIIIAFSIAMGWILTIEQIPQNLTIQILALTENKYIFLALLLVVVLIIGCVVEGVPATLILVPTLLPLIDAYNIDRVHFGVIITLGLLCGIATPPMGIGLYIVSEVGKVKFEKIAIAVLPFLVPLIATLVLITYVPEFVTFLPNLVLGVE
nr:TRAP transporter large permease [uncultured Cohaesibacter sp.]